ncbi:MAG: hypothetical protein K2L70_06680 [Clostridia bacterium]|nr:hypothetical protein [Clostridia bacterium]
MATKKGAGGKPQEFDTQTGRYGSGQSKTKENSLVDENCATNKHKQKKIKQLNRLESEYSRIIQIEKYTGLSRNQSTFTYEAIKHYTRSGYRAIRSGKLPQEESLIETFIERHPKYDGKIWRGIAVEDKSVVEDLYAKMKDGEPIDMRGISSWTSEESVSLKFVTLYRTGTYKIIYESENESGVGIGHLSEWENEEEVLHSGKSRFRVKGITKGRNNVYRVKLEEDKNA